MMGEIIMMTSKSNEQLKPKEPYIISDTILKRVDLYVFLRFLTVINDAAPVKVTHLQLKTGTNYSACVKYVDLLERLQLVQVDTDGKNKEIHMTEKGRNAFSMMTSCIF